MKILQIISSLDTGGAEKFVVELSNELVNEHNVTLVVFKEYSEKSFFQNLIKPNINQYNLKKKSGFRIKTYFQLYNIIKKEKPNIIHFHLISPLTYIFPFLFIFPNIQFVYTIHNELFEYKKGQFYFYGKYLKKRQNLHFVTISKKIKNQFKEFYNCHFNLILNGVNKNPDNKYTSIKKEVLLKFLSIGRVTKQKNFSLLVDLAQKNPNIYFEVIGPLHEEYEKLQSQIEIQSIKNLVFLGPKQNVSEYLSSADAFVMTSIFEGMPISMLEALSCGIPILTTPAGGVVDIIENGQNGWISEDFEIESFQNIINNFLNSSSEKLQKIKNNNISKYNQYYSMKICAEKYLKLYKNSKI